MDIQTRKLNIISYIAQLTDENFIGEIEEYILNNTEEASRRSIPFSIQEFIQRIKQSEEDYKNGRYKTQSEVEELSKEWERK